MSSASCRQPLSQHNATSQRVRVAALPLQAPLRNQNALTGCAGHRACRAQALGVDTATPSAVQSRPGSYSEAAARTRGRDVCEEQVGFQELEVEGTIPQWLAGDLYRTGPGINAGYNHLFDGLAMLVHFRLGGGGVQWQQRYIQSIDYQRYMKTGSPQMGAWRTYMPLLQSMALSALELSGLGTGITDNASVTLQPSVLEGELVALTESINGRYRIQRDTCDTIAQLRELKGSSLKGPILTAHPVMLPDGSSVNVCQDPPTGRMQIIKTRLGDPAAKPEVLYDLQVSNRNKRHSWIHDIASTDEYLVIVEQPAYLSLMAIMGAKKAEYSPLDWCPEHGTSIRIARLDGGGIIKCFRLPPFFAYHYINAVEVEHESLGRCLRLDAPLSSTPKGMNQLDLEALSDINSDIDPALLKQIYLPLEQDREPVIEDMFDDHSSYGSYAELPCINPAYKGKTYRYAYVGTIRRPSPGINTLSKVDVQEGSIAASWFEEGGAPLCEAKFVARPGAEAEDDGVVLMPFVHADGRTSLVVLDAQNLSEIARAYTPKVYTTGFHSTFVYE